MSVVSAAPADKESTERVSYTDSKTSAKDSVRDDSGWIELASATPASHGKEYITVGADAGTFTRLRIDAASGRPIVRAVRIDYKNGQSKTMRIDSTLDAKRKPSAVLDLKGAHEIEQVVVITERDSKGNYAVFAEGEPAQVATR